MEFDNWDNDIMERDDVVGIRCTTMGDYGITDNDDYYNDNDWGD